MIIWCAKSTFCIPPYGDLCLIFSCFKCEMCFNYFILEMSVSFLYALYEEKCIIIINCTSHMVVLLTTKLTKFIV